MLAGLDETELFPSSFAHTIGGAEPGHLVAQIVVNGFELGQLMVALIKSLILVEVGLDRQTEQGCRQRPGDRQGDDRQQERTATLLGDPSVDLNRSCDVSEP